MLMSMSANTQFITEAQIEIQQYGKLKDLCYEMERLVDDTNKKMNNLLENQQVRFFKAFKQVLEQMFNQFQELQKKFDDYIAFHENETEVVNAQNKLVFFRKECQLLNTVCKDLKEENKQLKSKIYELENENYFQHKVLQKTMTVKQELQTQLDALRECTQPTSRTKKLLKLTTEGNGKAPFMSQMRSTKNKQTALSILQNVSTSEITNMNVNKSYDNVKSKSIDFHNKSYQTRSHSRQKTNPDGLETTLKSIQPGTNEKEAVVLLKHYVNDSNSRYDMNRVFTNEFI